MIVNDHVVLRPDDLKANVFSSFDSITHSRTDEDIKEIMYRVCQRIQREPHIRLDILITQVVNDYDREKSAINTNTELSPYEGWVRS